MIIHALRMSSRLNAHFDPSAKLIKNLYVADLSPVLVLSIGFTANTK